MGDHLKVSILFVLCCMALLFQNCSGGFEASGDALASEAFLPFDPFQDRDEAAVYTDCDQTRALSQLSESCLGKTDLATAGLANFKSFRPQYPMYRDGAEFERWIYLPKDSQINTSNLDQWIFPVGTVLWKQISVNGAKIETQR